MEVKNCYLQDVGYAKFEKVVNMIGGKWKLRIIYMLALHDVLRYGELKRLLTPITHKMLTAQLKELEKDGLAESNRTTGRMVTTDAAIIEVVRSALAQQCIDGFYEGMEQLGYTQEAARQKLEEQSNGK